MGEIISREVLSLAEDIEWAWNRRDAAALSAAYMEGAVVFHPLGLFRGLERIDNLHNTMCRDPERMGYMQLTIVACQRMEPSDEGFPLSWVILSSRVLDVDLRNVTSTLIRLVIIKKSRKVLIVQETEMLKAVQDAS